MRALWKVVKVMLALLIAVPLAMIVLATTLGILGAVVGLAVFALKIAIWALIAVGIYKLGKRLFGGSRSEPLAAPVSLPPVDPYYRAAMQELDRDLGGVPTRN